MSAHNDRDRLVVEQVLRGQRDAFRELVDRYRGPLHGLVLRMVGSPTEADDLTQLTFVEAFRALARYDGRRSFATWLMRIAVNNCKDHLKSHKRRERQLQADVGEALFSGHVPGPEQGLRDARRAEAIETAIAALAPMYRLPLVLKDVEGLSYREIQQVLDLPVTTLKIRVVRARAKLQEQLRWLIETS